MYETIKNFNKQFLYKPKIKNKKKLKRKLGFIVVGMGGSALAPLIIKTCKPKLDIIIHNNYGLPELPIKTLKNKLIILSSYSGNTEEVIEAFKKAKNMNLDIVVISVGGKLLSLAKENNTPYIELPNTGIQPRSALGLSIKAFLKIIEEKELRKINKLAKNLKPTDYEKDGKILAQKLKNYVPIIYASNNNKSLAYNWKIKLNETGKIPAFYNIFPELNHNEMTGFDVKNTTKKLSDKFYFIILKDLEDDIKILKRINILEKLYTDRNLKIKIIELTKKESIWHKIFSSLILADWIAYYTALEYGQNPEQVPMVEEFKKLILK